MLEVRRHLMVQKRKGLFHLQQAADQVARLYSRQAQVHFSSLQLRMIFMRSEKPTSAPRRLSEVSPNVALETVPMFA